MRIVCASCGRETSDDGVADGLVSHGYCRKCFARAALTLLDTLDNEALERMHGKAVADIANGDVSVLARDLLTLIDLEIQWRR